MGTIVNLNEYASGFSTNGLLMMHKALRDAFHKDEQTPSNKDKPYGVRTYSDWRQWSDALESELADRGAPFEPVPW